MLPTIIKAIEEGQHTNLKGPEEYLAIAAIILAVVTQGFRYLQSIKLISSSNSPVPIGTVNNTFESGTPNVVLRPESAIKPDGPGNISPAPISASEVNVAGV
jgi:hypothetical protein